MALTRYNQITEIFLVTRLQIAENQIFFFLVCKKKQKEDKSKFVTKLLESATQFVLTDHLNHKTVKKRAVENPQQILANYGHIS